jgi:hypothetical protein
MLDVAVDFVAPPVTLLVPLPPPKPNALGAFTAFRKNLGVTVFTLLLATELLLAEDVTTGLPFR